MEIDYYSYSARVPTNVGNFILTVTQCPSHLFPLDLSVPLDYHVSAFKICMRIVYS